ncbi:MAG: nucleoside deaminase [Bacilli bacterium]|nr:nucleoside deaminase [Bacilli bacterium]
MLNKYMEEAIKEAQKSLLEEDIPVGCIIVENGKIIAKAHNTREKEHKITGHAEINAIEKACKKKKTWHLTDCELYTTLEPCEMCIEAIKQARIRRVYFDANKQNEKNIKEVQIEKIQTDGTSEKIIKDFFKNKRK